MPGSTAPWALVTGASEGIGRAFAVELAQRGVQCQVVLANLSHPHGVQQALACTADRDLGLLV